MRQLLRHSYRACYLSNLLQASVTHRTGLKLTLPPHCPPQDTLMELSRHARNMTDGLRPCKRSTSVLNVSADGASPTVTSTVH
jgi:hypothetical protein